MSEAQVSLNGVWQGLYVYPWGRSDGFVATLIQHGERFSGATHEQVPDVSETLFATVEGRTAGSAVFFRKTYDGTGGWGHTVLYSGQLSADGGEIDGEWRIPPHAPGRFLMIRQSGKDEAVERCVSEEIDG